MTAQDRRTAGRAAWLAALVLSLSVPGVRAQGALSALQTDVDRIAGQGRPCVVTVFSQRTVTYTNPLPGQAARRPYTRVGSGVAVGESTVLTTASVVLGAERVVVQTVNGIQVEADVAGIDPIFNVALLSVPELKLPALRFSSRPAQVGDWVVALGTSYGAQSTQSVGTIAYRYREPRSALLELTNAVYPGNSGGAVLNAHGELVGIIQGELGSPDFGSNGPDAERRPNGLSFVLPIEQVRPVYESLRREGRVRHGYLGVSTRAEAVQSETDNLRIPIGAMVESVKPGGPAARLGLVRGDLVVAFDSERVEYPEQLARWVAQTPPGTGVNLVWVHDGMERKGRVPVGESPSLFPDWVLATSRPGGAAAPDRINEIERQMQNLSRELQRLKGRNR